MKLTYALAFLSIAVFIPILLVNKAPREFYIKYLFIIYPLLDLPITSAEWGSLKVFDGISYLYLIFLFKDFVFQNIKNATYLYLFLLFLIVVLLGSLLSEYISASLISTLTIFPVVIYTSTLIRQLNTDPEFIYSMIRHLKIIAIVSLVFLVVQMIIGLNFTFYPYLNINTIDENGIRYPSFFHEPQKFGQLLAILSFIFLVNPNQYKDPKIQNYASVFILMIGMLATGGRSAFIGLFGGLLFLFFVLGNRYKLIMLLSAASVALLLLSNTNTLMVLNRAQNFGNDLSFRAALWDEAINIFQKNPVLGIGYGNFKHYAIQYSPNFYITPEKEVVYFDQPESGYLMILSEVGAVGFILVFSLIILPIVKSLRTYIQSKDNLINMFFIAGLISWLLSFVSVYSLYDTRMLLIVLTLLSLLIYNKKDNDARYTI